MKIIGLTGGIASGKNFVAKIFLKKGAAIFDADYEVHNIFNNDKNSINEIAQHFPQSFLFSKIDRNILGKIVFSDVKKLKILEDIIHPKVRKQYLKFLKKARFENKKIVILNIPLLLEKKGYKCDKIISLIVAPSIQKRRFLARHKKLLKSLSQTKLKSAISELENKFKKIQSSQMNNHQRKILSDFIIDTGKSKAKVIKKVNEICKIILD